MLTTTIDWLSFTIPEGVNYEALVNAYASDGKSSPISPQFGYTAGWKLGTGVLFFTNQLRPDMGTHFIISGKTLGALQSAGKSIDVVLHEILSYAPKITRLDLAKDALDEGISLPEIWRDIDGKRGVGRTQKFSQVQGSDGGHTIYAGSRQSERFARIYDKAKEQGDNIGDYKRCELELKGDVARAVAKMLDESEKWGEIFNGLLTNMLNCPCQSFQAFLGAGNSIGLPKIEKQTDREAWISGQVIPAVSKHIREFPSSDAVRRLFGVLKIEYEGHDDTKGTGI